MSAGEKARTAREVASVARTRAILTPNKELHSFWLSIAESADELADSVKLVDFEDDGDAFSIWSSIDDDNVKDVRARFYDAWEKEIGLTGGLIKLAYDELTERFSDPEQGS